MHQRLVEIEHQALFPVVFLRLSRQQVVAGVELGVEWGGGVRVRAVRGSQSDHTGAHKATRAALRKAGKRSQ